MLPQPTKAIPPALAHFPNMPDEAQVTLPVVKGLFSVGKTTIYRLVKEGHLKAYKLTGRTTTFNVGELRAFLKSKAGV